MKDYSKIRSRLKDCYQGFGGNKQINLQISITEIISKELEPQDILREFREGISADNTDLKILLKTKVGCFEEVSFKKLINLIIFKFKSCQFDFGERALSDCLWMKTNQFILEESGYCTQSSLEGIINHYEVIEGYVDRFLPILVQGILKNTK